MIAPHRLADELVEHLAAELTAAAHEVALRYDFYRSFATAELDMWKAMQDAVYRSPLLRRLVTEPAGAADTRPALS